MSRPFLAALALASAAAAAASEPSGSKPVYLESFAETVPNLEAIGKRIWTPGLDESWVPQGLTVAEGHALVSSYRPSPDLKSNTEACRVFRIDPASGKTLGPFDMGEGVCTHAGGLAYVGNGRLLVADTRQLIPHETQGAAFDAGGSLWISASSGRFGRLYRLDRQGEVKARYETVVGLEDLGFDASGRLWAVSESGTRKYLQWPTHFPFVFEIDPTKLK